MLALPGADSMMDAAERDVKCCLLLLLGWENGLQHASQCEQQLNDILKSYLENWEEEEQSKKKEK